VAAAQRQLGRKAVTDNLKSLSNTIDWQSEDAVNTFAATLFGEDDRGVIILCAGSLEDALEAQLVHNMPHLSADEKDRLFDYVGPIGTYSSRIQVAHAMGLISKQVSQKLNMVREIRNVGAHSCKKIDFTMGPIFDAVTWLATDLRVELPKQEGKGTRKTFIMVCLMLLAAIKLGSINDAHNRITGVLKAHRGS